MNRLVLHSTSLAQWYTLVNEAEDFFGKRLDTDLESYLVHLLQRYTNKPDISDTILAIDYLDSLATSGKLRQEKLRDVGDKCLLFSGFFPESANRRLVTVSYFVELGRRAYFYLAELHNAGLLTSKLYGLLRTHFVSLLDLLFSIRELSGEQQALTLLQAEELWRNTGSEYALKILKKHNKDITLIKNIPMNKIH
ncbi:MAG: hypothetical protein H0U71_05925 [Gammaproteobacteria bacterium]|nr:hypothetical protein [Gammaproteobacteria bacterium]